MAKWKIFAGMSGGFGGAEETGIIEAETEEDAMEEARQQAIQEYQSYEGLYGVMNWEEVYDDIVESFGYIPSDEEVEERYLDQIESWIEYWVEPAEDE